MENGTGWIKLYRKMSQWEWYKISTCVHLLIHLSFTANREDKTWRGIVVKRGQRVTTRKELSVETGISEQTLRTDIKRLQLTNSIKVQSTNKYTIITVCNYELYQGGEDEPNQEINQQVTNDPTTTLASRSTTTKEIKNKEYNNLLLSSRNAQAQTGERTCVRKGCYPEINGLWAEELMMMVKRDKKIKLNVESIKAHYESFKAQMNAENPDDMQISQTEWRRHFANYLRNRASQPAEQSGTEQRTEILRGDYRNIEAAVDAVIAEKNNRDTIPYEEFKRREKLKKVQ